MTKHVTATDASRNFSTLLNAVQNEGEAFVILRNGQPVAELAPPRPAGMSAESATRLLAEAPALEAEDAAAFRQDVLEARARLRPLASRWD